MKLYEKGCKHVLALDTISIDATFLHLKLQQTRYFSSIYTELKGRYGLKDAVKIQTVLVNVFLEKTLNYN